MRVKMLRTVEPEGAGGVRFLKGTHVDVSDEQAKAWLAEKEPACKIDHIPGHDRPATPDLSEEKQAEVDARPRPKNFDSNGIRSIGSAAPSPATAVASEE